MRVLVCGDRNWTNQVLILKTLLSLECEKDKYIKVVIEGEARGADKLSALAARQMCGYAEPEVDVNVPEILRFPANWELYGRAAGPIRNQQMLDEGKPDFVLAFHNDIANSKGTADMVRRARKAGIETRVITEILEVSPQERE